MRKAIKTIFYLFLFAALFSCFFTFFTNGRDFYRTNVFGYRFSYILSESMEPTIMTHAICLTDMIHKDYKPGDVIVYEHEEKGVKLLISHRLVEIKDGYVTAKGDNNAEPDPWKIKEEDIVGKIIWYWNGFAKIADF